ncbi:hypothetical protein ACRARG_12740 [Pseudooceanicola sp. C21-150M6]|uniref:hypothetical protein n=1 Tax=Pseudooceanicola sp. C21-150M6 TaxID=3434355 RepID=UPI003D7F6DAC
MKHRAATRRGTLALRSAGRRYVRAKTSGAKGTDRMKDFQFQLGDKVQVSPKESGEVVGRVEYTNSDPQYFVRYVSGDGQKVERWWNGDALTAA